MIIKCPHCCVSIEIVECVKNNKKRSLLFFLICFWCPAKSVKNKCCFSSYVFILVFYNVLMQVCGYCLLECIFYHHYMIRQF